MIDVRITKAFIQELGKLARKNYPVKDLKPCMRIIYKRNKNKLRKIDDHRLKHKWHGYHEFHPARIGKKNKIYDNWIAVYKYSRHKNKNIFILTLVTTGGHDILKKPIPTKIEYNNSYSNNKY